MTLPDCVRLERVDDGAFARVVLARPKANILDAEMVTGLRTAVRRLAEDPSLRGALIAAEGDHFSFGASVEEHLPAACAAMLENFHGLFRELIALGRPIAVAVKGHCLGGGLELAAFAHRVFAAPSAKLGQPEIQLGVFAPVASLVLPRRIGQAHADDLLLSGRSIAADEAAAMGLVDVVADDPEAAALDWMRAHLLPKSAAAMRMAVHASRFVADRAFLADIERLEAHYLEELMKLADAEEGLRAFLDKRKPNWKHA